MEKNAEILFLSKQFAIGVVGLLNSIPNGVIFGIVVRAFFFAFYRALCNVDTMEESIVLLVFQCSRGK